MANAKIKGASFHHVALKVDDFDKSLAFFKAMGFEVFKAWGEGDSRAAMLDIGSGEYFEVFAGGKGETPYGRYFHLAIKVDSCDEAFAVALAAGARTKSEPRDVTIPAQPSPYPVRIAFVFGPNDEEIELFEVK